ncbi:MAG: metallophosphoesterase [Hyphomicrobiales bacterium]|nr:metallophosphoesterase [Hyphomicrobiales bacterium]
MFGKRKAAVAQRTEYPRLPQGERIYSIGDIHGRTDLLDRLHAAIDADMATTTDRATEVYLGDFVDRGPDSAGVIERLLKRSERVRLVAIRGNHEVMFEDFLAGEIDPEEWRQVGGLETLLSYGVDVRGLAHAPRERWVAAAKAAVPPAHVAFLAGLSDCFVAGEYYFTHAGVRPGVALDEQEPDDLQWVRDVFLSDERDHGAVIVHGHTPTMQPEFLPNRINLDTGAYLTGRLTCAVFDSVGPRLLAR